MEKTWLKHYPAGVPAEIDVAQYRSLVELLEEQWRLFLSHRARRLQIARQAY